MSFWDRIAVAVETAHKRTLGAVLDALARGRARRDAAAFSIALIALSAKMAKADGVVTDDEIAAFKQFFEFPASEAKRVRMVYELAQEDVAGFDHYLARVSRLFDGEREVLEDVLDCLFHVALADGVAHPREMDLLELAASKFGISDAAFRRVKAVHLGVGDDDPYFILGIAPDVSDEGLKATYRDLVRQHHPDAMIARGVPESLVKISGGRAAAINAAYEKIRAERAARRG